MKHNNEIERLIERFLDGRTTNSEEQRLYEWFSHAEVPEEWQYLKEMFAWYEQGMPEQEPKNMISSALRRRHRRVWIWSAASAAAVVLIAITLLFNRSKQDEIEIYEGSYIIENGVSYNDITYIRGEIEATLNRAEAIERKANELLAWADI